MKTKPASTLDIQRALFRTSPRANLETQLVASVLDYLSVLGFHAYRRNVGSHEYADNCGRRRVVRFGLPGQADLWALGPDGLHIEIELKAPGQKPRPNQHAWLNEIREAGAIAIWASSIEEFVGKLKAEFRKRGLAWHPSWEIGMENSK